jgi:hypothetical protein
VDEQLKNAKAMILMAAKQPIVREAIRAYANEHFPENERTGMIATVRRPAAVSPIPTGKAVESALGSLQGRFNYIDVIELLDERGVPLAVKNRRTAVGSVLRKLCNRKVIRQVEKGIAGKPSYFERLSKQDVTSL